MKQPKVEPKYVCMGLVLHLGDFLFQKWKNPIVLFTDIKPCFINGEPARLIEFRHLCMN